MCNVAFKVETASEVPRASLYMKIDGLYLATDTWPVGHKRHCWTFLARLPWNTDSSTCLDGSYLETKYILNSYKKNILGNHQWASQIPEAHHVFLFLLNHVCCGFFWVLSTIQCNNAATDLPPPPPSTITLCSDSPSSSALTLLALPSFKPLMPGLPPHTDVPHWGYHTCYRPSWPQIWTPLFFCHTYWL